ncbi:hypothetical protein [Salinicoccus halitifaciens]|uniref:Uncharacterized protein YacL n=1 Tax=Salinicoccus halitifaciens TaxID=1073415 RepID=A0ABV2EAU3_9STAP|nr:hypothetical protein [Salinicoccus halitifaciens]MCD2137614.1 hypothetical protein [Salinicoccus halitifaciens]
MNDNKISFLVYGAFFLILPVIHLGNLLINGVPLPLMTFYSLLIVAVMSFCFSYLAPNFGKNDETDKYRIVRRSVITGFIALFIAMAVGLLLMALDFLGISLFHLILIFITVLISAAFISAVIYTKRNLETQ